MIKTGVQKEVNAAIKEVEVICGVVVCIHKIIVIIVGFNTDIKNKCVKRRKKSMRFVAISQGSAWIFL